MALGDTNGFGGNNNGKDFHPTVYGYQFSNPEAKVDATSLSFNWWNKMLKLSVAPKLEGNGGDYVQYDHKGAISVYLGVQTAKAMFIVMNDFIQYMNTSFDVVDAPEFNRAIKLNSGIAIISSGEFINQKKTPCIILAKVNAEGKIEASFAYEFKVGNIFSIENYDQNTGKYGTATEQFRFMEIELFIVALEQYINAVSNMMAASVVNELQPMRNEMHRIADKLGVAPANGNRSGSRTSYFSNQSGSSEKAPTTSTLDEIGNM